MVKPHREKVPAQSEVVHPTFMVTVEIPTEVPSCDNITGDSVKLQNSHILANFQNGQNDFTRGTITDSHHTPLYDS